MIKQHFIDNYYVNFDWLRQQPSFYFHWFENLGNLR